MPVRTLLLLVATGALVVGSIGGLSGCCTVGVGPCTTSDRFTLVGANDLNACGGDEQSHPVAVRFYALKGTQKFQGSTFEDIWGDPGQTLGGELVGDPEKVFVDVENGRTKITFIKAAGVASAMTDIITIT